jgi:hypothetical protein
VTIIGYLSYDDRSQNIKIEINRRIYGSRYEMNNYLGISMLVMVKEDMFAHKLVEALATAPFFRAWGSFWTKNRKPGLKPTLGEILFSC